MFIFGCGDADVIFEYGDADATSDHGDADVSVECGDVGAILNAIFSAISGLSSTLFVALFQGCL